MSNILKEISERRSIRKYKDAMVSREQLLEIIEAGRLAPSGSNTQPWRFMIVTDKEKQADIVKADHGQNWMLGAPAFIVVLADISCRKNNLDGFVADEEEPAFELKQVIRDSAVAISFMLLEAQHLGLGTCWTAWFEQKDMRAVLGTPENMFICGVITVGFADEKPAARPRKPVSDLILSE